jgi:hypothetical protein
VTWTVLYACPIEFARVFSEDGMETKTRDC